MAERGVSKTDVQDTIEHPLQVSDTKYGRKAAISLRGDDGYTIVIFETDREGLILITASKTNGAGAKRYGFTGI
jgi:hypothetical protein